MERKEYNNLNESIKNVFLKGNVPEQLNEIASVAPGFASGGLAARAAAGAAATRRPSGGGRRQPAPGAPAPRPATNKAGETGQDIINRINSEIASRTPAQRTAARADAMKDPNVQAGVKARQDRQAKVTADIAKANVEPSKDQVDAAVKKHETARETARTTPGTKSWAADQEVARLGRRTAETRQGTKDRRIQHAADMERLSQTPAQRQAERNARMAGDREARRRNRLGTQQGWSKERVDQEVESAAATEKARNTPEAVARRAASKESALKKMADMNKAWDAKTPEQQKQIRADNRDKNTASGAKALGLGPDATRADVEAGFRQRRLDKIKQANELRKARRGG